jgi:gamma-glutamyltranspeptidase/glutathione hydrolase
VVAGAGFILNNEMDDFSAKPGTAPNLYGAVGGKANAIAPNKRPLSSMTPTIVTKGWEKLAGCGHPGRHHHPDQCFPGDCERVGIWPNFAGRRSKPNVSTTNGSPTRSQLEEGCLSEEVQAKLEALRPPISNYRGPIGRVEAIVPLPERKMAGRGRWTGR